MRPFYDAKQKPTIHNLTIDTFVNAVYKISNKGNLDMNDSLSTPRLRRREARIQSILNTSMMIVEKEGLNGLTIKRLAEELDYTPGAFYRYFASKDDILIELQNRTLSHLKGQFIELWKRCDLESNAQGVSDAHRSLVRLLATTLFYQRLPKALPTSFSLIHLSVGEQTLLLEDTAVVSVAQHTLELLSTVAAQYEEAQSIGALDDGHPMQRAVTTWSSLHGVVLMNKFERFEQELFDVESLGKQLSQALFIGWGGNPETINEAAAIVAKIDANGGLKPT